MHLTVFKTALCISGRVKCVIFFCSVFVDPPARPTITAGSDVFTYVVRPSVLGTFHNLAKQNNFQLKTMFTTGKIVDVAEWIIDDTLSCGGCIL